MQKARNTLLCTFWSAIVIALIIVILYETDIMPNGVLAEDKSFAFILLSVMEVVTICLIPLALRLFKFNAVKKSLLTADRVKAESHLVRWGLVRMGMLCLPMIMNTLFYYLFMSVAFGYMGIIGLLSLVFIYPSVQRCHDETSDE